MKTTKFYTRYNPAPQTPISEFSPSMTIQDFAHDTDINNILAKFLRTGLMENIGAGTYEDVSEAHEYREALHLIAAAQEQFSTLPAATRKTFDNDPVKFMEFVHTTEDKNALCELGLLSPSAIQTLQKEPENLVS